MITSKISTGELKSVVKAGMNLKGTANERLAEKYTKNLEVFKDIPSGDSLLLAGKNALKDIIPENSINYIA